ncbi:MAG: hypothetical protein IH589_15950 [Anaerolineales bacterium]|nr:hypothetical protein [Anaerolineales bacterium]
MDKKKYSLLLLGVFALIYLFIKVLTFYAHSLIVLEFAFIAMIFGLSPAYFLREVFKFGNLIGWLVNSSVLGILFIPFLFIILGWLGINLVFVYSISFLYICSFVGIIFLFIFVDDNSIKYCSGLNGLARIDILFYLIIVAYTLILTLLNFYRVYIQWDAFTFWGLDAKYIFQLNRLRDPALDVFGAFRYTAYYPVYYSIIYDLYGAVAEQYANWINVFLNFLALLLVYNNACRKNFVHKLFIITMLTVVSYIAVFSVNMLSMYADVLCAFILLLFMKILTADYWFDPETYYKRMLLLLLVAISLYFIKSPFLFLTLLLVILYIFYDLYLLLKNWGVLTRHAEFWLVLAVVTALYFMRFYYFAFVLKIGSDTPINDLYSPRFSSLYSTIDYAVELIYWLVNKSPYFAGMWILGALSVFVVKKNRMDKTYSYVYWISFFVVFIYCVLYIINQSDLTSGSLVRYCAIVIYLIPFMFIHIEIKLSRVKTFGLVATLLIVLSYVFIKTMTPMPLFEQFSLSTGSYNVILKKESRIAEKTLDISGDAARILIVDDFSNDALLGNMYLDAIFVRYFLMFNSVGGQYMISPNYLYDYALSQSADYILLLTYTNTFDHCERMLVEDHNYLIKINGVESLSTDECVFVNDIIFDLSK